MKYVALLRAINVGGRNMMPMADIRTCLEARDFQCVSTYIQSGNVLFESDDSNGAQLTTALEHAFSETFGRETPVFLRSYRQMKKIVADAPRDWKRAGTLRQNVAFLRKPLTAVKAIADIDQKPGVDSLKAGDGVVYMSTVLAQAAQSRFPKIVGKPMYRDMTIRTFGTCRKILELMDADDI